jgi:uncharacterized protein (TIGR03437 family)
MPQQLSGVRVYVEGWPAIVSYVSPTQINAMPFHRWNVDSWRLTGSVPVEVVTPQGRSAVYTVNQSGCSPGLFRLPADGGKWAIATAYSDGALIGPTGVMPGTFTRPARAGDILTIWGTGFGLTNPPVPAGTLFNGKAPLASDVNFSGSEVSVTPSWAGLAGAGLYQFNFTVPSGIADGDYQFRPQACQGVSGSDAWITFKQ